MIAQAARCGLRVSRGLAVSGGSAGMPHPAGVNFRSRIRLYAAPPTSKSCRIFHRPTSFSQPNTSATFFRHVWVRRYPSPACRPFIRCRASTQARCLWHAVVPLSAPSVAGPAQAARGEAGARLFSALRGPLSEGAGTVLFNSPSLTHPLQVWRDRSRLWTSNPKYVPAYSCHQRRLLGYWGTRKRLGPLPKHLCEGVPTSPDEVHHT